MNKYEWMEWMLFTALLLVPMWLWGEPGAAFVMAGVALYLARKYDTWLQMPFDGRHRFLRWLGKGRRRKAAQKGLGRHALYRWYGAKGELLYVGITSRPLWARMGEHWRTKKWVAHEARRIEWEYYKTRDDLEDAEKLAIRAENPKHNKLRY